MTAWGGWVRLGEGAGVGCTRAGRAGLQACTRCADSHEERVARHSWCGLRAGGCLPECLPHRVPDCVDGYKDAPKSVEKMTTLQK